MAWWHVATKYIDANTSARVMCVQENWWLFFLRTRENWWLMTSTVSCDRTWGDGAFWRHWEERRQEGFDMFLRQSIKEMIILLDLLCLDFSSLWFKNKRSLPYMHATQIKFVSYIIICNLYLYILPYWPIYLRTSINLLSNRKESLHICSYGLDILILIGEK